MYWGTEHSKIDAFRLVNFWEIGSNNNVAKILLINLPLPTDILLSEVLFNSQFSHRLLRSSCLEWIRAKE